MAEKLRKIRTDPRLGINISYVPFEYRNSKKKIKTVKNRSFNP